MSIFEVPSWEPQGYYRRGNARQALVRGVFALNRVWSAPIRRVLSGREVHILVAPKLAY